MSERPETKREVVFILILSTSPPSLVILSLAHAVSPWGCGPLYCSLYKGVFLFQVAYKYGNISYDPNITLMQHWDWTTIGSLHAFDGNLGNSNAMPSYQMGLFFSFSLYINTAPIHVWLNHFISFVIIHNMNSKISGRPFEYNRDMMVARSFDTPGIDPANSDMEQLHSVLSTLSLQSRDYRQVYIHIHWTSIFALSMQ